MFVLLVNGRYCVVLCCSVACDFDWCLNKVLYKLSLLFGIMTERKRSANWLLSEKMLLLDLVADHFSIIENKKTDGVTMKQKIAEWIQISDEFNSQAVGHHRTAENLKAQWESLKKTTKKAASSARQSLIQTGGGPAKPRDNDPTYNRIMGLLSTSAIGLSNKFDSDSIIMIGINENDDNPSKIEPSLAKVPDESDFCIPKYTESSHPVPSITLEFQDEPMPMHTQDWGDYTPKLLQTPVSSSLRVDVKDTGACPVLDKENSNITPKLKAKPWTSKRRPTLPISYSSGTSEELQKIKIKAMEMQMKFAETEREEAKILFELNSEIQKEILKQQKLKTKLLLINLRKIKREHKDSLN